MRRVLTILLLVTGGLFEHLTAPDFNQDFGGSTSEIPIIQDYDSAEIRDMEQKFRISTTTESIGRTLMNNMTDLGNTIEDISEFSADSTEIDKDLAAVSAVESLKNSSKFVTEKTSGVGNVGREEAQKADPLVNLEGDVATTRVFETVVSQQPLEMFPDIHTTPVTRSEPPTIKYVTTSTTTTTTTTSTTTTPATVNEKDRLDVSNVPQNDDTNRLVVFENTSFGEDVDLENAPNALIDGDTVRNTGFPATTESTTTTNVVGLPILPTLPSMSFTETVKVEASKIRNKGLGVFRRHHYHNRSEKLKTTVQILDLLGKKIEGIDQQLTLRTPNTSVLRNIHNRGGIRRRTKQWGRSSVRPVGKFRKIIDGHSMKVVDHHNRDEQRKSWGVVSGRRRLRTARYSSKKIEKQRIYQPTEAEKKFAEALFSGEEESMNMLKETLRQIREVMKKKTRKYTNYTHVCAILPYQKYMRIMEFLIIIPFAPIEYLRISWAHRGNILESSAFLLLTSFLAIPILLITIYLAFFQTYVLLIEEILCYIQAILVIFETLLSFSLSIAFSSP
ncbi:unnamed protein product [Caenorhabditis bovis]|uniref:G-protein coupled receptors family 1 profile domain-containing protein n=1 Tax=Caenorhabditis bovis TaxID=2654633 RepID=A0A8S1FBJ8_9PELO|nr:unnamed protein product [Caenorhabditis bovis]